MDKNLLFTTIEEKKELLTALSDKIWAFAELSMAEYASSQAHIDILRSEGFTVRENLCDIPTAFLGRYGSGRPVIGILGEFDALSGLSQKALSTNRAPLTPDGCGHGCGHNLLGAGALGADLAIKEQIKAGSLKGTIIFYGCPGEEGCAGKAFMARDGMFRDLDAAITWHPSDVNEVTTGSNAASIQVEYTFTGVAAHAAGDPENGRSALDAAELMNIGVQFLREHMPKTGSVHYSFADAGGISPNVVQPTAKLIYMVRGDCVKSAKKLLSRVENIAKGAAIMTDTTVTWHQIDGTSSTLSNHVIEKLLYDNLCSTPLPQYTNDELAFAREIRTTFTTEALPGQRTGEDYSVFKFVSKHSKMGTEPLNGFVIPYAPSMKQSPGSTDVGDVSWLTPTAQFTAVTWASGSPGHSWQNVSMGKSSIAHKGMIYAAKVLAGAAADLMEDPHILKEAREEFSVSAAEGYDCPVGKEVTPTIG